MVSQSTRNLIMYAWALSLVVFLWAVVSLLNTGKGAHLVFGAFGCLSANSYMLVASNRQ